MKKLLFILALTLVGCSKEDEPEEAFNLTQDFLIGTTWDIYSKSGNTDLNSCYIQEEISFTESHFNETIPYWGDAFLEENCRFIYDKTRYKVENNRLDLEYEGGAHYYFTFKDEKTLEVRKRYPEFSSTSVFKKR